MTLLSARGCRAPALLLTACALTVTPGLVARDDPAPAPQAAVSDFSPHAVPADFVGEWRAQADAARVVEHGVHDATAAMNFITRPIARRRLLHRFPAPTGLRLRRDGDMFVLEFLGPGAVIHRLPVSGGEVRQHGALLHLHFERAGLRHTGATDEGRRENLFRLGKTRDVLTMETVITSAQLPQPVRYTIVFERVPPVPVPGGS
ncbi:MAG TPA: hypothetical protein VGD81_13105 [Opitutaceae bacterium]